MGLLFEGLKVLDCGSFIAAPAAATILSDFGADVIKIEAAWSRRSLPASHEASRPSQERSELCVDARFAQQAQPRG